MSDLKTESRRTWVLGSEQTAPSHDQLKLGCLQRIADATEQTAKNHVELINARNRLQLEVDRLQSAYRTLERRNAALRGVITKLKR